MRLCKIFGKLHYVFMGNRWQSGKTHGKEEEGERRDHQEVQRADKMSSRSESIMLEIDICPFLASIISWIYGNLHCSSCGIWWYLNLNVYKGLTILIIFHLTTQIWKNVTPVACLLHYYLFHKTNVIKEIVFL